MAVNQSVKVSGPSAIKEKDNLGYSFKASSGVKKSKRGTPSYLKKTTSSIKKDLDLEPKLKASNFDAVAP